MWTKALWGLNTLLECKAILRPHSLRTAVNQTYEGVFYGDNEWLLQQHMVTGGTFKSELHGPVDRALGSACLPRTYGDSLQRHTSVIPAEKQRDGWKRLIGFKWKFEQAALVTKRICANPSQPFDVLLRFLRWAKCIRTNLIWCNTHIRPTWPWGQTTFMPVVLMVPFQ